MNNGYLGMVRQWQSCSQQPALLVALAGFPDASMLAGRTGSPGRTVEDPGEIGRAMDDAVRHPGPYLLNVKVSSFECVYPMVPAGAQSTRWCWVRRKRRRSRRISRGGSTSDAADDFDFWWRTSPVR